MGKKNKKSKKSTSSNPLLDQQRTYLQSLSDNDRDNFFSNTSVDPERRAQLWMDQADLGSDLVDRYSWATPDERALIILKKFSPIVEVGCGANAYWCRVMKAAGIDVLGYDIKPKVGGKISADKKEGEKPHGFPIMTGGPEVLAKEHLKNRTLLLCYPDEESLAPDDKDEEDGGEDEGSDEPLSLGSACLEHFQGKHVIHVGELYGETLSLDQAPWGRSSGPDFQQRLASEYHCVLKASLTNWLHVRDTISVWKRSEICTVVFDAEDEDDEEEEVEYRHIPKDEILPVDIAAPCLAYLLDESALAKPAAVPTSMREIQSNQTSEIVAMGEKLRPTPATAKESELKTARHSQSTPADDFTKEANGKQSSHSTEATKKKKKKTKRKRSDSNTSLKSGPSETADSNCPW
jgi:hypothetical protein